MFLPSRQDGAPVKGESTLRQLMPFILPRRNDAVVYFEQTIDVTKVLSYLDERKKNALLPEVTFFEVLLSSMLRANFHWPRMNRFVAGKTIYKRNKVGISFVVKKQLSADASMTTMKVEFEGHESLFDVVQKIEESIAVGRSKKLTKSEKEMKLIHFIPGFVVSFFIWAMRKLDGLNLLPSVLTRDDPLYTSMVVANLGSFGLDAPFHHLYEHGTAPIFAAIGKIHKAPMVDEHGQVVARDVVKLRYSFDERITDGFYCARALGEFADMLQTPDVLETPSTRSLHEERSVPASVKPFEQKSLA